MFIFPPVNVGTTPYVFDPATGRSKLVYLRITLLTGGSTVYMGPTPTTAESVYLTHVRLDAGRTRVKWTDYDLLRDSGTDPDNGCGNLIRPGWVITSGSDAGVTVKKVDGEWLEFSSALSAYADDSIDLGHPFAADPINGYPLLSPSTHEFTDERFLSGSLSFATGSGSTSVSFAFELS